VTSAEMSEHSTDVSWDLEQFEATDPYEIYKQSSHEKHTLYRRLNHVEAEIKHQQAEIKGLKSRVSGLEEWAGIPILSTFAEASFQKLMKISTKEKGLKRTIEESDEEEIENKTKFHKNEWIEAYQFVNTQEPSRNNSMHHNILPAKEFVLSTLEANILKMNVPVSSFFYQLTKKVY
jgi:hypothetical protein